MPAQVPSKKLTKVAYDLIGKPSNLQPSSSKVVRIINTVMYAASGARMIGSNR